MYLNILKIFCFILLTTTTVRASDYLNYSGRLVLPNGAPVTGPVHLLLELAYTDDTSQIKCHKTINSVPLVNGIFHLKLDFDCGATSLNDVLMAAPVGESVAIRVTDVTNASSPKAYAFQAFYSVPYTKVAETSKTIAIKGTATGQVLKWDGSKWVSGTITGSGIGAVTEVNTGTGLSGGPITDTGTISISPGGVTTTEIAANTIVNANISSAAAIARAKVANGTPNYVVVNGASGELSEVQYLPLTMGGTGAGSAAGAIANLGLGSAALANVGTVMGNVVGVSAIPSCGPTQKIQMSLGPSYVMTCVDDADSADDSKLPLLGGVMEGNIVMDAHKITQLAGPTDDGDAANKKYVDDTIAGNSYWSKNANDLSYDDGYVGVGLGTAPEDLFHVGGNAIINGKLRLKDSTVNFVELRAPTVVGATFALTLPGNTGTTGQVLTTDGAGILSWSTVATTSTTVGGDLTGTIANAQIASGAITDGDINASAGIAQSKIAGLVSDLAGKEPTIAGGTAAQYWRGDKTWQTLNTDAVAEGTKLYFLPSRVLATQLAGYVPSSGALTATDTVLSAFGKLEGQIGSLGTNYVARSGSSMSGDLDMSGNKVTGLDTPTAGADAATKAYVDSQVSGTSHWVKDGSNNLSYSLGKAGVGTPIDSTPTAFTVSSATQNSEFIVGQSNDHRFSVAWNFNATEANAYAVLNVIGDNAIAMQTGNGKVGIGTAGPVEKLHVVGSISSTEGMKYRTADGVPWWVTPVGNGPALMLQAHGFAGTPADRRGALGWHDNAGVKSEVMTWTGSGNIGIGTTDPQDRLDVIGSARVRGSVRFQDTGSNYVEIKSPATLASSITFNLPGTSGSTGQALITDGSGNLSWSSVATTSSTIGGDLSGTIANAQIVAGSVGTNEIADGSVTYSKLAIADGEIPLAKVNWPAGTTSQYLRGDKTWQELTTSVVPEGTNLYHNATRVMGSMLVGYAGGTALPLGTGDTLVGALGKLEAGLTSVQSGGQWVKSGNDISYTTGITTVSEINFANHPGDPTPVITSRLVPAGQGNDTPEKTELILFHSNDPANGSGTDQITLRAPGLSFQTYNDATVGDINNPAGYNVRMYIDPTGVVSVNNDMLVAGDLKMSGPDSYIWTNGTGTGFTGFWDAFNGVPLFYVSETTTNVGIGTTNPASKFEIYGGGDIGLRAGSSSPSDAGDLVFYDSAGIEKARVWSNSGGTSGLQLSGHSGTPVPAITIDSSERVGIGNVLPSETLDVNGNVKAVSYLYTSDKRLKKNVKKIENSLEKVLGLRGVEFDWIVNGAHEVGLIAQEVEKIEPNLVVTNPKNGMKSVKYGNIVPLLIEAVKDQDKQVKKAEREIANLKSENEKLKGEIEMIKRHLKIK